MSIEEFAIRFGFAAGMQVALIFLPLAEVLLAFFGVRMVLLIIMMYVGPRKLGTTFEAWKTPFLDFMYAFYYLVTGAKALIAKKVKWKI